MSSSVPPVSGEPEPSEIAKWLASFGFSLYAEAFEANGVTLDDLGHLTDADLKSCGVKLLMHRKIILQEISKRQAPPPPAAPAATPNQASRPSLSIPSTPAIPSTQVIPVAVPASREVKSLGAPQPATPKPAAAAAVAPPTSSEPAPSEIVQAPPAPVAAAPLAPIPLEPQAAAFAVNAPPRPGILGRFWNTACNNRFLFISIGLHLVFALVATVLIVQTITTKRKLTFLSAPPSSNPGPEHQVQMAKKQKSMNAPTQARRASTTGLSRVTLPEMPTMPTMVSTDKMSSMTGAVPGLGAGSLGGRGGGGRPSVGGPVPFFGFRNGTGTANAGFVGHIYDLKQTKDEKSTGMTAERWVDFTEKWINGSWDVRELQQYYASPQAMHTPLIYIPNMAADEGPKAFGVEKKVQPRMWLAHYKATVTPPVSGTFRFIGCGDDILAVRFNGKLVFDHNIANLNGDYRNKLLRTPPQYSYPGIQIRPLTGGEWFTVTDGGKYEMEVLIGECPGGFMCAFLMIEKEGAEYEKDEKGTPILPVFRLANVVPKAMEEKEIHRQTEEIKKAMRSAPPANYKSPIGSAPPFSTNDLPWSGKGTLSRPPSALDALKAHH